MLQHVDIVLIGKNIPASYTTADALAVGDVALFDQNRAILKTAAEAANATSLYVGVAQNKVNVTMPDGTVAQKANIKFGNEIKKDSKPSAVIGEYVAPVQDKITITLTDATIVAGHRYVLRMVYKDMYEAPGQFTHTYEVIAKTTNATDLITSFKNKINNHKQARVVATSAAAVLTLTAKEIPYNQGITLDAGYCQVSMDVFMWKTIPSGLLSNVMYPISNLTIAKTQGTPGRGNAYIVRDRENWNLGYEGIQYRANAIYPYIAPEFRSDLSAEYDTLTLEWDNLYLSNDNQYIKTTPLSAEIYVNKDEISGSAFETALKAFVAKA